MARWLLLILFALCACSCRKPHGPLEVSFWYWHTPFQLSVEDLANLKSIGVKRLFVRGGTFTHDVAGAKMDIRQRWGAGTDALPIVLVYNWDSGLISHFATLDVDAVARCMIRDITASASEASKAGAKVTGIQFDIDAPTRLLPTYATLASAVRKGLNRRDWSFSATALSSWLGTRGIAKLAEQVDFLAPQFYESRIACRAEDATTISDLQALSKGLDKGAELPVPFYAGLASYGHAVIYDEKEHLAGIYRGLTPEQALQHPSLRFDASVPQSASGKAASAESYVGEDLLKVKAFRPGASGRGMGYTIAYSLPTPRLINEQMQIVKAEASQNCKGVILYRLPGENDTSAVPLVAVRDALAGRPLRIDLSTKVNLQPQGWRKVEGVDGSTTTDLSVKITNVGNSPSALRPGAVRLIVNLTSPGVDEALPGGFDSVQLCALDATGKLSPASKSQATSLVFARSSIQPGQSIGTGHIRVAGTAPTLQWEVITPGGFQTISDSKK